MKTRSVWTFRKVFAWGVSALLVAAVVACTSPEGDLPERAGDFDDGDVGHSDDVGEQGNHDAGDIGGSDDVDDNQGDDNDENDGNDDNDENGDPNGEEPELDVQGTWVKLVSTKVLNETIVGGEEEAKNVSVLRVDIEQDGTELELFSEVCSLEIIEESSLADTTIPDSFVDALEPTTRQGSVADGVFELFWDYEVRGVEFDSGQDPETEPLPTDDDDPRVFDQNGDGNPGLTIEIDASIASGDVYVIQRGSDQFESTVVDDDQISGIVDWEDEQEILGASNSLLLTAEPENRPHPDDDASYFEMIRLGDDEADDCDTLASERDQRFDIQSL